MARSSGRALLVVLGAAASLVAFEVVARTFDLTPSVQTVPAAMRGASRFSPMHSTHLRMLHGVPVWGDDGRAGLACVREHPERVRVAFFGDSITYGVGVRDAELFTTVLQARLDAARPVPGFCVLNFAQPGFGFDQSLAIARDELPALRPAFVFFEFWSMERDYRRLGTDAYEVHRHRLRGDGFPSPLGAALVPDAANSWLFAHSAGYRWLAFDHGSTLRPDEEITPAAFAAHVEATLPSLFDSVGAHGVLFAATPLGEPFDVPLHGVARNAWIAPVYAIAHAHGMTALRLDEALLHDDPAAIRLDSNCHFNPAGHRRLAEIFAQTMEPMLR